MTRRVALTVLGIFLLASARPAYAQAPAVPQPAVRPSLRVDVVISRYRADKKISSLPYQVYLSQSPGSTATSTTDYGQLRIGTSVDFGRMTTPNAVAVDAGLPTTPGGNVPKPDYQWIGTQIDCRAERLSDGRYRLSVAVQDSSLWVPEANDKTRALSGVTSYTTTSNVVMSDGQTQQFSVGVEKLSGEVIKADVTLTVLK